MKTFLDWPVCTAGIPTPCNNQSKGVSIFPLELLQQFCNKFPVPTGLPQDHKISGTFHWKLTSQLMPLCPCGSVLDYRRIEHPIHGVSHDILKLWMDGATMMARIMLRDGAPGRKVRELLRVAEELNLPNPCRLQILGGASSVNIDEETQICTNMKYWINDIAICIDDFDWPKYRSIDEPHSI